MAFSSYKDRYAGGLMVLVGLFFGVQSSQYTIGNLKHVGPGFFPLMLSGVLVLVGIGIALQSRPSEDDEGDESLDLRGAGAIIAGILAFIALVTGAGLIPAAFACVFISAFGDREMTLRLASLMALVVSVAGSILFIKLLQLPLPLIRGVL